MPIAVEGNQFSDRSIKRDLTAIPVLKTLFIFPVAAKLPTGDIKFAAFATAARVSDATASAAAVCSANRSDCQLWLDQASADGSLGADCAPLWEGENPLKKEWLELKAELSSDNDPERGADWSFWIKWYEDVLAGLPQNWDMLYEIATSEAIDWDASSREVNEAIARIVDKFSKETLLIEGFKENVRRLGQQLTEERRARSDLDSSFRNLLETKLEEEREKTDARFQIDVANKAMESPSTLWDVKRKEHEENAGRAYWSFVIGLVIVLILLGGVACFLLSGAVEDLFRPYGCDLQFAPELCSGISFKSAMMSVIFATILTLAFWFLRVQLKVHFSERHLAIDARERMSFADAYVELLKAKDNTEGAAEQGLIVYNALFRPTGDGIIKDEGGLDPSISAALSKFLAR